MYKLARLPDGWYAEHVQSSGQIQTPKEGADYQELKYILAITTNSEYCTPH